MRKQSVVRGALGALALVLAVVLIHSQVGTSASAPEAASRTASRTRQPLGAPTPPPSGSHAIRGRVLDAHRRPAAGIRVSATLAMPGESLSALPCDTRGPDVPLSSGDCEGESEDHVKGLVEAGHGGTPVLAQALTSEDGTFQLDALPEGAVTLWAFGDHDAAMAPDVRAGEDGVELRLEASRIFPGRVIDESGAGLAGARVTLFHQAHSRFFEATTDTEGRFTFGPLPKGDYSAVAFAPDLLPEYRRNLDDAFTVITLHPSRGFSGRVLSEGSLVAGAEVHLVHSSKVTTTDQEGRFSFEHLSPGDYEVRAEHLGRHGFANVTLTEEGRAVEPTIHLGTLVVVEGVVRDESGRPIAGAEVSAPGELGLAPVVATTEADGRFRLGPLRLQHYVFTAVARGYQRKQLLDVTLSHSTPPLEFILQRAHVVQGTVTDADGRPVQGAKVVVASNGEEYTRAGAPVTDAQGHFDLEFPRPMSATLIFISERHLTAKVPVEAPALDVRVVLRAAAQVEGTLTNTDDVPLHHIELSLTSNGQHPTQDDRSDDSGRFLFGGLPPGTYTLHAEVDVGGIPQRASRTVTVQGTETVDASLRLYTGLPVSGIVVDERGRPVADAEVEGNPLQGERAYALRGTVSSGPDGRFTLHHMPKGACELRARKEGYDFESAKKQFPGDSSPAVRAMAGDEDVRLELRSMGRVRGRLVRSNGTPIPHFFINGQEVRNPEGAFRISARVPWGMRLEFAVPGLNHTTRELDVSPGEEVDLGTVRMEAGRQIRGRVLDAETLQPIKGAFVEAHLPGQGRLAGLDLPLVAGHTGPDGTFHLPPVEDRPLDLLVRTLDGSHPESRRQVGTGDMDLELRLYPGAHVEGTMTDRDGQPVEATVWLVPVDDVDPDPTPVSVEEAAGTFRAHGVPGGTYMLNVAKARTLEGRPVTFLAQRVQLPPMGRVTLAVRESPGSATVRLSVRLPPGLQEEDVYFLELIPGSVPPTTSTLELRMRAYSERLFGPPQDNRLSLVYEQVPAGRYTFIVIVKPGRWDEPLQVYWEELTVTDGATLTRDIHVVLRPGP